jgi:hypothetical protein
MTEDNNVQKIERWKPMSKRPIGRPKTRWEDDVLGGTKSMNICNWKKVAQNRDNWKKVVEQARTFYRLWCFIRRTIKMMKRLQHSKLSPLLSTDFCIAFYVIWRKNALKISHKMH